MNKEEIDKIVTRLFEKMISEEEYNNKDNKGIVNMHYGYIEINNDQKKDIEYKKIESFLHKYMEQFAKKNKTSVSNLELTFINYGKTEIVYILKNNSNNYIETLLVKLF